LEDFECCKYASSRQLLIYLPGILCITRFELYGTVSVISEVTSPPLNTLLGGYLMYTFLNRKSSLKDLENWSICISFPQTQSNIGRFYFDTKDRRRKLMSQYHLFSVTACPLHSMPQLTPRLQFSKRRTKSTGRDLPRKKRRPKHTRHKSAGQESKSRHTSPRNKTTSKPRSYSMFSSKNTHSNTKLV
jgi:hypothetical protein